jgi:hypothetical protein
MKDKQPSILSVIILLVTLFVTFIFHFIGKLKFVHFALIESWSIYIFVVYLLVLELKKDQN